MRTGHSVQNFKIKYLNCLQKMYAYSTYSTCTCLYNVYIHEQNLQSTLAIFEDM